jgi:hypothetical protein
MATANSILDNWGKDFVNDLRQSLKDKGVTFQGGQESRLGANIRYEIKYTEKGLTFDLIMPDYYYYVDKGRKAGNVSKEGQAKIKNWAERKGIVEPFRKELEAARKNNKKRIPFDRASRQLAFLIARAKKTKDKEGNNFYTDIKDKKKEELKVLLAEFYKKEIVIQFGELD